MLKHWPPLNYLRGFEAAARLGSFHKAANELHVTQSAVSQQIRSLENYLGQPLFDRHGRSISLTDAGHDLLSTTQALLSRLAAGIRRLDQYRKPNQLVINTPPAFARHWLVSRLADFRRLHPEIDLWLLTTDLPPEMATQTIDIAVRDDIGPQANCRFKVMRQDRLTAVCRPELLESPVAERATLHGEREMDWSHWHVAGGENLGQKSSGLNFSDPGVLLDAACSGLGIALVSELLGQRALAERQIVRLSEFVIPGPDWACLIHPDCENSALAQRFCQWLQEQLDGTKRRKG
jgi:LysR family glycine cleavage system transcriptional activator